MVNIVVITVLLMPGMNCSSWKRKILPDCNQVISIIVHCGRHIIYNDTINRIHKINWKFDFETFSETIKHGSGRFQIDSVSD